MDAELFSGALAGGLGGLYSDYSEQRRLAAQQRLADMRAEVQAMIASMNESGRNQRWETPSGNVVAQQVGANQRNDAANASRETIADKNNQTKRDVVSENNAASMSRLEKNIEGAWDRAFMADLTRQRGQDMSSADRRYGIDTGAATTRRGQDIGAATARRGQDLNFSLGTDRNLLTQRGQDIDFDLGTERNSIASQRAVRGPWEVAFGRSGNEESPNDHPPARDVHLPSPPPRVVNPSRDPNAVSPARTPLAVTPRAGSRPAPSTRSSRPVPPENQAAFDALATEATAVFTAFLAEKDSAKKAQLQRELVALKKRKDALLGGGGADER